MKPLRLVSTPTRNRRLNEILGLVVLVSAALLLLALATYTPTDPSADTVGGFAARLPRPAHNWTGLAGAWLADAILQTIGIAAFFLPIVLGRVGLCWMRQRAAGSAKARLLGLALWIVFAPAAIGLLPHTFFWRHALPIEGVTGRLLADAMVHYLNLPGASIVLALMVAMSLYLATTFTFHTASEWAETHLSLVRRITDKLSGWRARRALAREAKRVLTRGARPAQLARPHLHQHARTDASNRRPSSSNASASSSPPNPRPSSAASSAGLAAAPQAASRRRARIIPGDHAAVPPPPCGSPCPAPSSTRRLQLRSPPPPLPPRPSPKPSPPPHPRCRAARRNRPP